MHPDLIGLYYTLTTTHPGDVPTRAVLADFFEENDLFPVSQAVRWMMDAKSWPHRYRPNRLTITWCHVWYSTDLYPHDGFFADMECDYRSRDRGSLTEHLWKIYGSIWRADLAFFQTYLSFCAKLGNHGVNKENIDGYRSSLRQLEK